MIDLSGTDLTELSSALPGYINNPNLSMQVKVFNIIDPLLEPPLNVELGKFEASNPSKVWNQPFNLET